MINSRDKVIRFGLGSSLLFIAIQIVLGLVLVTKLPPEVPLFYSRPWGERQLASPFLLFLLPVVSILVLFVNSLLATTVFKKEPLVSRLMLIFSTVISFLCLVTFIKISFLVI
jgi:hypothetical protein